MDPLVWTPDTLTDSSLTPNWLLGVLPSWWTHLLGCVLPWLPSPALILTCRLTSQLDLPHHHKLAQWSGLLLEPDCHPWPALFFSWERWDHPSLARHCPASHGHCPHILAPQPLLCPDTALTARRAHTLINTKTRYHPEGQLIKSFSFFFLSQAVS